MLTVSFVPDVAQCTAAARVFAELGRWRWARFGQGAVLLLAVTVVAIVVGPGPWLAGAAAAAAIGFWSLLTVFGPWYAPRRLRGTFWIGELVTCRITSSTLSWWSQPGLRELPWHQIEAVGTRDGVLALRTGQPYQLIWLPLAMLTADQLAGIVRRATSVGADTRRVRPAGERLAATPEAVPRPVPVGAGTAGGDRWFDGLRPPDPDAPATSSGRTMLRPGDVDDGRPIVITAGVSAAQALAVQRAGQRPARTAALLVAVICALLAAAAAAGVDLTSRHRMAALAGLLGGGLLAFGLRRAAQRVAALRYRRELGDEPVHWIAGSEGVTMSTRRGNVVAAWSDVLDARLDEGMLVIRFDGRRRRIGIPLAGCSVADVDRILCWLGTSGVWILAF